VPADFVLQLVGQGRVVLEIFLGVLAPLPQRTFVVAEERAALFHQADLDGDVEHAALAADAIGIHHVELGLLEGRGDLVLGHAHPGAVADHLAALLDALHTADVDAHAGVELERPPAGGRLRGAEHDADFLAELVGKEHGRLALLDRAAELAQRLAHQAGLQADVAVAHLALDLGAGHQRRDRVNHNHVNRPGAHQRLGDLQRLLGGVRLADVQVVDVDADAGGKTGIEGVLHVHKRADAAALLRLADDVQAERGLAGSFRAINLGHAATGNAADAQGDIQGQRPGRDDFNLQVAGVTQAQDRAVAIAFGEIVQGGAQGFLAAFINHCLFSHACATGKAGQYGRWRRLKLAHIFYSQAAFDATPIIPPGAGKTCQRLRRQATGGKATGRARRPQAAPYGRRPSRSGAVDGGARRARG